MEKISLKNLLIVLCVLVAATGCVSNKRHNREVGMLQSQVNTLASEVSRIDSQVSQPKHGFMEAFSPRKEKEPAPSASYVSTAMYRTPSGFEVPSADVQRALKGAGFYDGDVDGKIGPKTRDAIREFQRANNLEPDGVCGRKTWDLLKSYLSSGSAIK